MIRKLKRKFIFILMSVVTLILLAIFISMLLSTSGNTRRMSENMLRQAIIVSPMQGFRAGEEPLSARMPVMVAKIGAGNRISFQTNQLYFIEEDKAEFIVQLAMNAEGETGVLSEYGLRWLKSEDGSRIAFADISMEQELLRSLIVNSLPIGGAALAAFFLVSLFLSRWAVRPVERAWDRQRQFVADASHELKTPLTVILSNADMLRADHTFDDEKKARRMEHIQAEAVRMKRLVEDMLILAKSDGAEKTAVLNETDFSDVVTNAALIYEPIIYDEKKKLLYDVQDNLLVMGDMERLKQLMHILLDNANKYCPNDGLVEIELKETDQRCALLKIFNEGEPIPLEELDKIFLRFYRRDESRSDHAGFGLGLAIANSIVSDHNGRIWAESKAGFGNTFFVSLPLISRQQNR